MIAGAPGVRPTATGARLDLRVTPRASKNEIAGIRDGRLLVRVTAPPVDAAANEAAIALVAGALGVPKSHLTLVAGASGRNKTIEVLGVTPAVVVARLQRQAARRPKAPGAPAPPRHDESG